MKSISKSKLLEYHQEYLLSLQIHLINPPLNLSIYKQSIHTKGRKNAISFEAHSLLLTCFELGLVKAKFTQNLHRNLFNKLTKVILDTGGTKKALLRSISYLRTQPAHRTRYHTLRDRLANPEIIKALQRLLRNPFPSSNTAIPIQSSKSDSSRTLIDHDIANPFLTTSTIKPSIEQYPSSSIPNLSKSKPPSVDQRPSSSTSNLLKSKSPPVDQRILNLSSPTSKFNLTSSNQQHFVRKESNQPSPEPELPPHPEGSKPDVYDGPGIHKLSLKLSPKPIPKKNQDLSIKISKRSSVSNSKKQSSTPYFPKGPRKSKTEVYDWLKRNSML
ncbi:hypothetical protein EAE96_003579 [Botrytis aclada]|nr:hypothetical protein EAE96_003579 [Botrytis aclada]